MYKIISGIGGLLGGLALFAFWRPLNMLDACIRSGISTGSAIIFAVPALEFFELSLNMHMILVAGAVIGFFSWSILSMISRMLKRLDKEEKDIIDAMKEVRSVIDKK
jgi:sensor histidine kinase YesM